MNTFLPFPDFAKSAACLDTKRLGKQRLEVLQLLSALHGETIGWRNHPAARMWRGYEYALVQYGVAVCVEWVNRGYNDTLRFKIALYSDAPKTGMPPWFGDEQFHASHRSNLKRKDHVHYAAFDEPADLPYIWPVK